jgi:uncharacterized protein YebE (UPF0316 family)
MGAAALIFSLRVVGVAVGTVRLLLMGRGVELPAALLGALEAFIYIAATAAVVTNLTDWPVLAAYCFGFSAGTLIGMRIEKRVAVGYVSVRAFSRHRTANVAAGLRDAGFLATASEGLGRDGPVAVVETVVPRRKLSAALATVREHDAGAFVVVHEPRHVAAGVRVPIHAPLHTEPPAAEPLVEVPGRNARDM